MSVESMAAAILKEINRGRGTTFVEIMQLVGPEGKGDLQWELAPNVVIWANLSESLVEAMKLIRPKVELDPTPWWIYACDGSTLLMPLAKRTTKRGYKTPHWLPVAFFPKGPRRGRPAL